MYALDFDSGVYGGRSGAALQVQGQVLGAGPLFNQIITPPEAGTADPNRLHFNITILLSRPIATHRPFDLPVWDWECRRRSRDRYRSVTLLPSGRDPDTDADPNSDSDADTDSHPLSRSTDLLRPSDIGFH